MKKRHGPLTGVDKDYILDHSTTIDHKAHKLDGITTDYGATAEGFSHQVKSVGAMGCIAII